uniref:Uncharacterized protein n=1 Tax=Mola mola TaxID=94237 RepID=A0A3Q3XH84_MOLML
MSVTMAKYDGVTVFTLTSDPNSFWPPMCQILKSLCYSPMCCSVSQHLKRVQKTSQSLLGVSIMVGLFNIGLGPGRTSTTPGDLTSLGAAYWLGTVFIITGIMTILVGEFPSNCLVGFTVFMNIVGAIFAIAAIVLYDIDLANASLVWMCDSSRNNGDYYGDNCRNVALLVQVRILRNLLTSMDSTLIAMAVLQLYISVRCAVLGIQASTSDMKQVEV